MDAPGKLLIVNADDLGRTRGINAGIFEAHERGLVTSATLMVGFPDAEDAARGLERHPALGVGLHVTLSGGGRPLSPPEAVPSLVDADGRLPRYPDGLSGTRSSDVLTEARAQLERFERLTGRPPTHLDSHHHSHRLPAVLEALVTLARERRLPVRAASPEVAAELRRAGVATTDAFVDSFFGEDATLEHLLALLDGLEAGVTELMCHPARVDDELRSISTYTEERTRELAALTASEARRRVRELGIKLRHFGNAGNAGVPPAPASP